MEERKGITAVRWRKTGRRKMWREYGGMREEVCVGGVELMEEDFSFWENERRKKSVNLLLS